MIKRASAPGWRPPADRRRHGARPAGDGGGRERRHARDPLGDRLLAAHRVEHPSEGYERELPAEIRFGPNGIQTVPSGLRVKQAYVILDGAADIDESRDWLAIARPVVPLLDTDGTRFIYGDVTAIVRMQRD